MRGSSIRRRMTYANVASTLALVIAFGAGTAYAAVVVTSNADVAKDTISGHKPPTGDHSNIITGSVNATDLANGAVTPAKIKAPEAWHQVGPGSTTQDLCSDASNIAVFCSTFGTGRWQPWTNFGAGFATAGFYKDQLGIVHLKGLVVIGFEFPGTDPVFTSIFRLPAGYRPTNIRLFPAEGRNFQNLDVSAARVDVRPDGIVELEADCTRDEDPTQQIAICSATGEYLTLDGISFRPDE